MWPFRKRRLPEIPAFRPAPPVVVPREHVPPEEPSIVVEENRDPSDSMILRFVHKLKGE